MDDFSLEFLNMAERSFGEWRMAFSTNGGGSTGRGGGAAAAAISEINVTPFVDVVLVLLIIFMLTAHVMEFGIEVDVPKVRRSKKAHRKCPW